MSTVYIRFPVHRFEERQRSPLLEGLLARAVSSTSMTDWRAQAFAVIAPSTASMPPAAAVILQAVGPSMAWQRAPAAVHSRGWLGPWVCVATPVHLSAGMSSVLMPADGVLSLSADIAVALATDFNRVFGDSGARLCAVRSRGLLCAFDRPLQVLLHAPDGVVGHDVFGFQPVGADAPRIRGLMSEMEMWLFDHPVNAVRVAQGQPTITGLWLWGGGASDTIVPAVQGWTAGSDPLFSTYGDRTELAAVGNRATQAGVVVCEAQPGTTGWTEVETRWLRPCASGLRSGAVRRLLLSAAERCVEVRGRVRWRFWRRTRPWWESFEREVADAVQ